jgi:hypothetical protein
MAVIIEGRRGIFARLSATSEMLDKRNAVKSTMRSTSTRENEFDAGPELSPELESERMANLGRNGRLDLTSLHSHRVLAPKTKAPMYHILSQLH